MQPRVTNLYTLRRWFGDKHGKQLQDQGLHIVQGVVLGGQVGVHLG